MNFSLGIKSIHASEPLFRSYRTLFFILIGLCLLPLALHFAGLDFGTTNEVPYKEGSQYSVSDISHFHVRGAFTHTILEWSGIMTAILTAMLAFLHYRIKKDNVTPILGVTLLGAGLLDAFHILIADRLILILTNYNGLIDLTWFVCRLFASFIILAGTLYLLLKDKKRVHNDDLKQFFIALFGLVMLLELAVFVFIKFSIIPKLVFPEMTMSRPLEMVPLAFLLVAALFIIPRFYKKYPSEFTFALALSMVPAMATQLYMSFSSSTHDSFYNISHFLKIVSYAVPFIGITFDYIGIYKKAGRMVNQLEKEVKYRKRIYGDLIRREQLYRTLVQNIPRTTVVLFNQKLIVSIAEGTSIRFFRFTPAQMEGREMEEVLAVKNEGFIDLCRNTLDGEEYEMEKTVKENIFHLQFLPVEDAEGNIFAGMVIFRDITAYKSIQADLKAKVDELQRSNEELEQFAYVASHDLQEPLRKIRAFGDRLTTRIAEEKYDMLPDYIGRMQQAATRMQVLINDLLTFSRVARNKNEFEKLDIREVVLQILDDMETRVEELNGRVIIDDDLPVIEAEPLQMRQIFQNLISNALKFHRPDEPPVVHISGKILGKQEKRQYALADHRKRYAEFRISDNGIGFDEKYLDRVFTIFQRLHGRTEYEGTGIGLAICRKISENHQGLITAESEKGKGATFIIVLPVKHTNHERKTEPTGEAYHHTYG